VALTKNSSTFTDYSSGLNYNDVKSLAISGGYIYVGATGGGVYKRALSDFGITIGVNELPTAKATVHLFPNPATEMLHIETVNCPNANVEVTSLDGKVLQSFIMKASETSISTDNLASGIYFIKVKTATDTSVQKFIKN